MQVFFWNRVVMTNWKYTYTYGERNLNKLLLLFGENVCASCDNRYIISCNLIRFIFYYLHVGEIVWKFTCRKEGSSSWSRFFLRVGNDNRLESENFSKIHMSLPNKQFLNENFSQRDYSEYPEISQQEKASWKDAVSPWYNSTSLME